MGGSSTDEVESTQTMEPWGPMQPHLQKIMNEGGRLYGQGGPGYYPGQTFAGRDPLSDQAQNLRLNYATNSMPGQIYDTQRAQSFALNSPDVANNPYVGGMADVIQERMGRSFTEDVVPRLEGAAVAAGQPGGSRTNLINEPLAAGRFGEALGDSLQNLYGSAWGKGLGARGWPCRTRRT